MRAEGDPDDPPWAWELPCRDSSKAERWVDALGVAFGDMIYLLGFHCGIMGFHKSQAEGGGASGPSRSLGVKHVSLDASDRRQNVKGLLYTCP